MLYNFLFYIYTWNTQQVVYLKRPSVWTRLIFYLPFKFSTVFTIHGIVNITMSGHDQYQQYQWKRNQCQNDPDLDPSIIQAGCTAKYSEAQTWFKDLDLLVQSSLNIDIQPVQQKNTPDPPNSELENLRI